MAEKLTQRQRAKLEAKSKAHLGDRDWYVLRSLLGNDWAMFYFLLGGRELGKSYSVTKFCLQQFFKYGRPFYWLRLTDTQAKNLLAGNGQGLVDPDLYRKFKLDLVANKDRVYHVLKRDKKGKVIEKKLMARVLSLSTFANQKGVALFDKDFLDDPKMYYNIILDEFQSEQGEKRMSVDITYAFTNMLENLIRSTKKKVRVFLIGNTLQDAADLLCAFDFVPEEFGRYHLHKKRCIIDYVEASDAYYERRKGTAADILQPNASTFTNKRDIDTSLIYKGRLQKPTAVIVFNKSVKFTVWDGNIIKEYHNEKVREIVMRPYLDRPFNVKERDNIMVLFDQRCFLFANLLMSKSFQKEMQALKPRK